MTGHANSAIFAHPPGEWSTVLAQDPDQDLEFDEGLEDDELQQHKPPTRRPLLWILILLIAIGFLYWTMKPDLAKLPGMPATSDSLPASPQKPELTPIPSQHAIPSTPKFGEGDTVMVRSDPSGGHAPLPLSSDSTGRQSNATVAQGDILTIIDGETVNGEWMYYISTASGEHGWILEKHLQKKL
ncbi:MAG: hypothetical protein NPIRA02_25450 [Nitrospirales bacterium]|nr:MAG: hypothetical protein NPIRA02_25450 [Nitrospirales bacterium]